MKLKRLLTFILFLLLTLHTNVSAENEPNEVAAARIFLLRQIANVVVNPDGEVNPLIHEIGYDETAKVFLRVLLLGLGGGYHANVRFRMLYEILKKNPDLVLCCDSPRNIVQAHESGDINLTLVQEAAWNTMARAYPAPFGSVPIATDLILVVQRFFATGEVEVTPHLWKVFIGEELTDPPEIQTIIERYTRVLKEHPLFRGYLNEVAFLKLLIHNYRAYVKDGPGKERAFRDFSEMILSFLEKSYKPVEKKSGPRKTREVLSKWTLEEINNAMLDILRHAEEIDRHNDLTYTDQTSDGKTVLENYEKIFGQGAQPIDEKHGSEFLRGAAVGIRRGGLTSVALYMFGMLPFANIELNLMAARPVILATFYETMDREDVVDLTDSFIRERNEWAIAMADYLGTDVDSREHQQAREKIKDMEQYNHLGTRFLWHFIERGLAEDTSLEKRIWKAEGVWHNLPSFDFIRNSIPLGFTREGHLVVENVFGETLILQTLVPAIGAPITDIEYTVISRPLHDEKIKDVWMVVDGKIALNPKALENLDRLNALTRGRQRAAQAAGIAQEQRAAEKRGEEKPREGGQGKTWTQDQIQKLYERGRGEHPSEGHR